MRLKNDVLSTAISLPWCIYIFMTITKAFNSSINLVPTFPYFCNNSSNDC